MSAIKSYNSNPILLPNPPSGYTYIFTNESSEMGVKLDDGSIVYPVGVTELGALSDVSLSSISTGEVLTYNGTAWVNSGTTDVPSTLEDLTDTNISAKTLGEALVWDGSEWINSGITADLSNYYDKTETDTLLDTKLDITDFETYTGTTAPAEFVSESVFEIYTGTTGNEIDLKLDITDFETFTGTTLPDNYYNETEIDSRELNDISGVTISSVVDDQSLVYKNGVWVNSGVTVDLSGYYDKDETDTLLDTKTDQTDFETYTGTTAPTIFDTKLDVTTFESYTGLTQNLSGLTDVEINSPNVDEYLAWDNNNSKWINSGVTAGISEETFETYTGTTAPAEFVSESVFETYTGTTAPDLFDLKLDNTIFETYTGTTAPAEFASQTDLDGKVNIDGNGKIENGIGGIGGISLTVSGATRIQQAWVDPSSKRIYFKVYDIEDVDNEISIYGDHTVSSRVIKYNTQIPIEFDDLSLVNKSYIEDNFNTSDDFILYTGTTAPAAFVDWDTYNTYTGTTTLSGLTDVTIDTITEGDFLTYSGTSWVNTEGTDIGEIGEGEFIFVTGQTLSGSSSYNLEDYVADGDFIFLSGSTLSGASSEEIFDDVADGMLLQRSGTTITGYTFEYGELYIEDNSGTTTSVVSGTSYTIIPWEASGITSDNITYNSLSGITIGLDGIYELDGNFSFSCANFNYEWYFTVFQNEVEIDKIHFERYMGNADVGSASLGGFLDCSVGDIISVRCRHSDSASRDLIVHYANTRIKRIK